MGELVNRNDRKRKDLAVKLISGSGLTGTNQISPKHINQLMLLDVMRSQYTCNQICGHFWPIPQLLLTFSYSSVQRKKRTVWSTTRAGVEIKTEVVAICCLSLPASVILLKNKQTTLLEDTEILAIEKLFFRTREASLV